jgi:short subunit dehydrogenase-like uncharacterized protein
MSSLIGVLGATGYTGGLVADELARRGVGHRLGGRDASRLRRLGPAATRELRPVDVTDPAALERFLDGLTFVINTVGPFNPSGLAIIEAADRAGVGYVDCSGELNFLAAVFERCATASVPVVVACGFQAIPGDLGAAIAMADVDGKATAVHVHYSVRMLPSRGTARTLVNELGRANAPTGVHRVTDGSRARMGIAMPLAEQETVRRAAPGSDIVTTIDLPLPRVTDWVMPRIFPRIRPLLARATRVLPAGPPRSVARRDRARVLVTARAASRATTATAELRDTYGLTARFLVEATMRARGTGAMAPSQAFDAETFLNAVSGDGPTGSFRWSRAGDAAR